MLKFFNSWSIAGGIVGGFLCHWLGGWDTLLKALVALVILDYVTGVLKALYTKTLSSETGFKGLIKKIIVFIVVATSYIIQTVVGDSVPLRDIVIVFFVCNEGISLLENASEFVPIPQKLKDTLIQLRDKEEKNHE